MHKEHTTIWNLSFSAREIVSRSSKPIRNHGLIVARVFMGHNELHRAIRIDRYCGDYGTERASSENHGFLTKRNANRKDR